MISETLNKYSLVVCTYITDAHSPTDLSSGGKSSTHLCMLLPRYIYEIGRIFCFYSGSNRDPHDRAPTPPLGDIYALK